MKNETIGTVVLGFGPQELDWLTKASKACGKGAVMDETVARMAGATLACGRPETLAILRGKLEAQAVEDQKAQMPGLSHDASKWLASGRRGLSSESIFQHLTGIKSMGEHWQHKYPSVPHDPSDLARCRMLLEQVPELQDPFREKMGNASPAWARLVAEWDEICAMMDKESPLWREEKGEARNTYAMIQAAIND